MISNNDANPSFRPAHAAFWLVLLTTLARLAIAAGTGLGFGESYYSLGALHPELSYFDQPPLTFWIGWLSLQAFGDFSPLALRLPSVLFFAGSCWLLFALTRRLFNDRAGFYAVLAMNLSAVFSLTGAIWFQPDAPLLFFWLATSCCIVRIFFRDLPDEAARRTWRRSWACMGWWLLAGVLLGLTTLSKYHAAFLFAGVAIYAISRKEDRHWLWHPGPYLALMINCLLALPVVVWNANNSWASFFFQAGRASGGEEFSLHFGWFVQSIIGQAMWLLPWIWLPLAYTFWRCLRAGRLDRARWFCACTAILPLAFFTVVTLWSNLGFHFHWQAPGYLMLFPALGALMADLMARGGVWRQRVSRVAWASAILTILTVGILEAHTATGFWSVYGPKWFGGLLNERDDPTMEGYDYTDLRERFQKEGWLDNPNLFVATDRWHLSGKAGWALQGRMPILCFHWDPRNIAFFSDQITLLGQDAIFISREGEASVRNALSGCFAEVVRLPDQWITRGGANEILLELYYCRDLRKPFPLPYGKEIPSIH